MKHVVYLKQQAEKLTLALQRAQGECDSIKAQCSECEEEMKPIEARLLEIRNIELEIGKYQAQKVKMETEYVLKTHFCPHKLTPNSTTGTRTARSRSPP